MPKPIPKKLQSGVTVKQLREMLATADDDLLVVLSKDGEGNNFSPFCGDTSHSVYTAESTWHGYIQCQEDYENDDKTAKQYEKDVNCLVLWPIN